MQVPRPTTFLAEGVLQDQDIAAVLCGHFEIDATHTQTLMPIKSIFPGLNPECTGDVYCRLRKSVHKSLHDFLTYAVCSKTESGAKPLLGAQTVISMYFSAPSNANISIQDYPFSSNKSKAPFPKKRRFDTCTYYVRIS